MDFYGVYEDIVKSDTYRFLTDRIQNIEQSGSFLRENYTDVYAWRDELRSVVKEKLLYNPPAVPFNEETVEEIDFGEYTRKKIYFDSAPGCRIPAYLLVPKGLTEPAPGVVVLHDHGAMFHWGKDKAVEHKEPNPVLKEYVQTYYEGLPVASTLAKRGYVALVIDCLFFGERSYPFNNKEEFKKRLDLHPAGSKEYIIEFNESAFKIESDLVRSFFYAGWTFMGVRTWDDIRSVDFLSSRPEVNPEKIGCAGLSMGGHRSCWLSALDDRVKCAIVVGAMQRNREMMKHRLPNIAWMWSVPGLYGILDQDDITSLSAPKPMMVVHGNQDWLFIPEETGNKAIAKIKAVYEKAGAAQNFVCECYDEPHLFNAEMQARAFAWMDGHLK